MDDEQDKKAEAMLRRLAGFQSLIPQFDNLTSITPKFFIESLEQITELINCTNEEKLLIMRSRIRGDALTNIINSPDLNQEKNYEEFKKKFLAYFDTQYSLGARQKQFSSCKMQPRELVKVYAAKVALATQQFFDNPDLSIDAVKTIFEQSKLAKFIDGLLPIYKQNLILKDPKNFDEAVNFVQMLQANEIASFDSEINSTVNNVNTSASTDQLKALIETHALHTQEIVNSLTKEVENLKIHQQQSQRPRVEYTRPPFRQTQIYNNNRGRQTGNFAHRNSPSCNYCYKNSHKTHECYFNPSNRGNYRGRNHQFQRNGRGTFRGRPVDSYQSQRYGNRQRSENP